MEFIKGITFAPFPRKGVLKSAEAFESLELLKKRTGASHIVLTPSGLQETPHSEHIDFEGEGTPGDAELIDTIRHAHNLGLKVIMKPTVNCKNGVWRAFINFFDKDVICEPKWSNWFSSHEKFQLHYAELAEKYGCVMFIAGCEMVMAERREAEWRELFGKLRQTFTGLLSYNTDKYQEDTVRWWDCVDVISSSGYYPFGTWERELDRIEAVVKQFDKPFFFAETGCMSMKGSGGVPNDWSLKGGADAEEQAAWYREMFTCASKRPWVEGFALWAWGAKLYSQQDALQDKGYSLFAKPAETVVREHYSKN